MSTCFEHARFLFPLSVSLTYTACDGGLRLKEPGGREGRGACLGSVGLSELSYTNTIFLLFSLHSLVITAPNSLKKHATRTTTTSPSKPRGARGVGLEAGEAGRAEAGRGLGDRGIDWAWVPRVYCGGGAAGMHNAGAGLGWCVSAPAGRPPPFPF